MSSLLCAIPFAASLFAACAPPAPLAAGYVEGEYVLVAPIENARIETIDVARGDVVLPGRRLAAMETNDVRIAIDRAHAVAAEAENRLENLLTGRRDEEIAVLEASLASARAQADAAARTLKRQQSLFKRGAATVARRDDALTAVSIAQAKVSEIEANLEVARLPARPAEIAAARARVAQARAELENAEWRLSQRDLTVPVSGKVTDIIRNPGEMAGPAAPVLSILPKGGVKLRIYLPQASLAGVSPGTRLSVRCDGCPQGVSATVSYVAEEPEFTPPVIYSIESRQKLVYLVEAVPDDASVWLKPGQIVDVDLAGTEEQ